MASVAQVVRFSALPYLSLISSFSMFAQIHRVPLGQQAPHPRCTVFTMWSGDASGSDSFAGSSFKHHLLSCSSISASA